jgi:hypothetical protein
VGSNTLCNLSVARSIQFKSQKQKSADRKHAALAAQFPSTLKAMRKDTKRVKALSAPADRSIPPKKTREGKGEMTVTKRERERERERERAIFVPSIPIQQRLFEKCSWRRKQIHSWVLLYHASYKKIKYLQEKIKKS